MLWSTRRVVSLVRVSHCPWDGYVSQHAFIALRCIVLQLTLYDVIFYIVRRQIDRWTEGRTDGANMYGLYAMRKRSQHILKVRGILALPVRLFPRHAVPY